MSGRAGAADVTGLRFPLAAVGCRDPGDKRDRKRGRHGIRT
jgi:hypothetical protein